MTGISGAGFGAGFSSGAGGMVVVEPAAMVAAAVELDAVAEGIDAARHTHAPALHAAPAGAEEVSLTVSRNQHVVADSFDVAAAAGAAELRRAAQALRMQAAAYASSDGAAASAVGALY
ncbi:PE domain-containing protein [Tomitella gaofuii]|uniref:PE domain-containing protein n=2 Tax=Tomitella gaofuii TaxID=2760083 RepID=UPI0020BEC8BA|nr:PE domain-containing protein [Tomitella gaofuii]